MMSRLPKDAYKVCKPRFEQALLKSQQSNAGSVSEVEKIIASSLKFEV